MTGSTLLIVVLGAAGIILAAFLYLGREMRVRGRGALMALRLAALILLVLLLLNPALPGVDPAAAGPTGTTWFLIDGELSLLVPSEAGGSLWEEVVERAEALAADGTGLALATPGLQGPEGTDPATLRLRAPSHPPGNLREGILRLAEAGADSVVVVSTFRRSSEVIADLSRDVPVPLRLERVGSEVRNVGIGDLTLPPSVRAGEALEGQLSLFGENGGGPGDSVTVELRAGEESLQLLRAPFPAPGAEVSVPFSVDLPADTGFVRVSATAQLTGDVFPIDDERVRWIRVGEPEGGVIVLSLRPDWEPRYLLPVLEDVTGLEGEGFLAAGTGRFLQLGAEGEAGRVLDVDQVQERLMGARLLVLHGVDDAAPDWVEERARAHPAVIHLPQGPGGAELAGLQAAAPQEGAWTPDPELPPSPISPFLSGLSLAGLPPLSAVFPVDGEGGGVVLRARGTESGEGAALLLLREEEGVRRGVATGQGFWRWAAREGEARTAYRALWSGVAGWLLTAPAGVVGEEVRPVARVQPRGEPLRWEVPPGREGSVLTLFAGEAAGELEPSLADAVPALQTELRPGEGGVASLPVLDPGVYAFEVRSPDAGEDDPPASLGFVEVERWAPSLRRLPVEVPDSLLPASDGVERPAAAAGRPMRTHPVPYLLILVLLCAEWFGRRRVGLR